MSRAGANSTAENIDPCINVCVFWGGGGGEIIINKYFEVGVYGWFLILFVMVTGRSPYADDALLNENNNLESLTYLCVAKDLVQLCARAGIYYEVFMFSFSKELEEKRR